MPPMFQLATEYQTSLHCHPNKSHLSLLRLDFHQMMSFLSRYSDPNSWFRHPHRTRTIRFLRFNGRDNELGWKRIVYCRISVITLAFPFHHFDFVHIYNFFVGISSNLVRNIYTEWFHLWYSNRIILYVDWKIRFDWARRVRPPRPNRRTRWAWWTWKIKWANRTHTICWTRWTHSQRTGLALIFL